MFRQVRKFKLIAAFANARRSDYAELASAEWSEFSHGVVKVAIGGILALIGALFVLTFASVAVIVTAWESDWRVLTAWLVAAAWLAVGGAGGFMVFSALRGMHPFQQVRDEFSKDIAVVQAAL